MLLHPSPPFPSFAWRKDTMSQFQNRRPSAMVAWAVFTLSQTIDPITDNWAATRRPTPVAAEADGGRPAGEHLVSEGLQNQFRWTARVLRQPLASPRFPIHSALASRRPRSPKPVLVPQRLPPLVISGGSRAWVRDDGRIWHRQPG